MEFTVLLLLLVPWLLSHIVLMPRPIKGIPHNFFARYMPWGDIILLGLYYFYTGEVFSWLSLQNLQHKSAIVQLFLPSFSTTHPTLVIADLEEISKIVTRRLGEIDRADLMHTWFGVVISRATIGLKSSDKQFKEQRRLWNVVLSPKFLADVAAECFFDAAIQLADLWTGKVALAGSARSFDAQEDIKMTTLDGIWKMCTGTDFGLCAAKLERLQEKSPIRRQSVDEIEFAKAKPPRFYTVLGTLLVCLDWVMLGFSSRLYTWIFTYSGVLGRASIEKDKILDCCIAASRSRVETKTPTRTCALDEVLRKHIRLTSGSCTESEAISNAALRDELLELLITGHETTASSIAWALKYLTDNPKTQMRLRASLTSSLSFKNCCAGPCANCITTTSLPFLDAVISETLRLSNTGPVSFRQTLVACEIMGHQIPADTPIILVTAGPSYDSANFAPKSRATDAEKTLVQLVQEPLWQTTINQSSSNSQINALKNFAPERWLKDGHFDPDAVQMLPFSAGSRGCFGKSIAMLELRTVIAVLIMRFNFPPVAKRLSGYQAQDGLTSRPQYCYVGPKATNEFGEESGGRRRCFVSSSGSKN
jgi:hypothetical protein